MAIPLAKHYVTPEEYYLRERAAEVRSDYYDGEIFDMSGGTILHSRICSNLIGELSRQLKGTPCAAFEANLRLRIMATGLRCYPDASVYCGPFETDPEDSEGETVTNPSVLFEVLSPSTENYDPGFKSDNYRKIPSLKAYALVSQSSPLVEVYFRQSDGTWPPPVEIGGVDGLLSIPSIGVKLSLGEIYDRVDFSKSASVVL